jgi:hypothetical protein
LVTAIGQLTPALDREMTVCVGLVRSVKEVTIDVAQQSVVFMNHCAPRGKKNTQVNLISAHKTDKKYMNLMFQLQEALLTIVDKRVERGLGQDS